MWSLLLALACVPYLPSDSGSPADTPDDSADGPREGCQDPSRWNLGGNGRYCVGSCDGQGIVCGDTMSPPRCEIMARDGERTDCDLPPELEDEELCETAIVTTCVGLIDP